MPLPKNFSFVQGAAIPEAWLTAFLLLRLADVKKGDSVVVYAGASGVGTAALQLCKLLGVNIWSVVSTEEKGKICHELGANGVVYYKGNANWSKELLEQRKGNFDAVLDCVGIDNCDSTI
jgi:NADPH:quinone reductase-like Zn-dependent oxidoreductase